MTSDNKSQELRVNVYSDESRHLKGQAHQTVIGSIWCTEDAHRALTDKVTLLKQKHEISKYREIKWTKVSPAKKEYYKELIELFFSEKGLNFRAVVIPNDDLRHNEFGQSEDEFYYKMQYLMLSNIVQKYRGNYKIYLDYKDTWSNTRTRNLASYLVNATKFPESTFVAQPIRSTESTPLQLADLLIGAVAYANNETTIAGTKRDLIYAIEQLAGQTLTTQTPFGVDKFNIFMWQSK